jgi:hypothetical protein
MTWVAVAVGGAGLIGASMQADAAGNAASQAAAGNRASLAQQQQMFNTINQQNQPWIQSGQNALGTLNEGLAPGGQFTHQFNAQDLNTNLAPNYQWQLNTGLQTNANAANAQGGLGSNEMVALNQYAQGLAGNAYQNAFSNYNTNQTNIFNRLSSIAGLGQNAAANVGNQGTTLAGNMGQASIGVGNAQAAGTIGQANAISGGLSNAALWGGLGMQSSPNSWYTNTTPSASSTNPSYYSNINNGASWGATPTWNQ